MNDISAPLLSICIPTYNRAKLLAKFLPLILEEASQFQDQVEVIVSDNCSTDATNAIASNLKSNFPLTYHRQSENIGAGRNLIFVADHLARGEFCWIVGDDDIVAPGAIGKLISIIKKNQTIDYIFVRENNINLNEIDSLLHQSGTLRFVDLIPFLQKPLEKPGPSQLLTFDELIDPTIRFDYLGFIANSIFRTSLWRGVKKDRITGHPFDSWENTYPHLYIFGKALLGKPAYYCNDILIVCGDGNRDWQGSSFWKGYLPLIFLQYFDEILSFYRICGVSDKQLSKCQSAQAEIYGQLILGYLLRRWIRRVPIAGANQIQLRKIIKYTALGSFWRSLAFSIRSQIKSSTIAFSGKLSRR